MSTRLQRLASLGLCGVVLLVLIPPFGANAQKTPAGTAGTISIEAPDNAATGGGQSASRAEAAANAETIRQRAQGAQQAASAAHTPSAPDIHFVQEALQVTRMLSDASQIALKRAVDPTVKALSQAMVARNRAFATELVAFAGDHDMKLAATPAPSAEMLTKLLKTGSFDTVFVRDIGIDVPTKAIARAGHGSGLGDHGGTSSLRDRFISGLREDLSAAQQIPLRNALGKTPNSSSGEAPGTVAKP